LFTILFTNVVLITRAISIPVVTCVITVTNVHVVTFVTVVKLVMNVTSGPWHSTLSRLRRNCFDLRTLPVLYPFFLSFFHSF
jgi:hypothetical protein